MVTVVTIVVEAVKYLLPPVVIVGDQLKNGPIIVRSAQTSRTVQVALLVKYEPGDRLGSVPTVLVRAKAIQDFLCPPAVTGFQLENRTAAVSTTPDRRTIQIAGLVKDQPPFRPESVLAVVYEGMQYPKCPLAAAGDKFENSTAIVGTTAGERAIEITRIIYSQASFWS